MAGGVSESIKCVGIGEIEGRCAVLPNKRY